MIFPTRCLVCETKGKSLPASVIASSRRGRKWLGKKFGSRIGSFAVNVRCGSRLGLQTCPTPPTGLIGRGALLTKPTGGTFWGGGGFGPESFLLALPGRFPLSFFRDFKSKHLSPRPPSPNENRGFLFCLTFQNSSSAGGRRASPTLSSDRARTS